MTLPAASWLALAGAVTLLAGPAVDSARLTRLTGSGRLGGAAEDVPSEQRPLPWRPVAAAGAVAAVAAVAGLVGIPLGIAAAMACAAGWLYARDHARRRAAEHRAAELRRALRVIIGELQAGSRPATALAAAAETAPTHARTLGSAARSAADGFEASAALVADPGTRSIGLAWRLSESIGADLAGVLARVEQDLVAAADQRRTVAVALAGPRASALLLAGLPVLGIGLGAAMGARPWDVLIGTTAGQLLACTGVLLDIAGLLWMRRVLHRAQRP